MALVVLSIMFTAGASALVITPAATTLEDYASEQEVVVTFYNDGFEPVGCEPTPTYTSQYLGRYVSLDPEKFLIKPGEQVNVKVTTAFPEDLSPQRHELVLQAYRGADENLTISFRPPGEQQVSLILQDFDAQEGSRGEEVTASMTMKNAGNTVLFVTPQLFVRRQGALVKNITYPRPIVLQPGESYPLTLRQDNSVLEPGEYEGMVQALYRADGSTRITPEQTFPFTVQPPQVQSASRTFDPGWPITVAAAALLMGIILWIGRSLKARGRGKPPRPRKGKREKHITTPEPELASTWREVRSMRGDLSSLSEEIASFAEESERWLRQRR